MCHRLILSIGLRKILALPSSFQMSILENQYGIFRPIQVVRKLFQNVDLFHCTALWST